MRLSAIVALVQGAFAVGVLSGSFSVAEGVVYGVVVAVGLFALDFLKEGA